MHRIRGVSRTRIEFGTPEYREHARHLRWEAHRAYAGAREFFWLNRRPYDADEDYDFMLAGRVFGAVDRYSAEADPEMHLAWVEDLIKVSMDQAVDIELDGAALFPARYTAKIMKIVKHWL